MKYCKIMFIVLSVFLIGTSVFSQPKSTVMAPPLKHEQGLYIDKDHRIYVPSKTPIYLRFATSPDDDAPSYLMYNDESMQKSLKDGKPNPFYLEGPGRHSLIHPSAAFLQQKVKNPDAFLEPDRLFHFYEDGIVPVSKKTVSKAPQLEAGNTIIYGKTIDITLKTTDESSGVKNTYYSIDGAEFTPYSAKLDITKEAAYNLRFYAVDNVGNVEDFHTFLFALDLTAPVTEHFVKNIHKGEILSPKAVFELKSTDNRAGVLKINYKFDSASEKTYKTKAVSPASLKDGDHKFVYYAVDKVANVENKKVYNFYLDKIPPTVTTSIEGDEYKKNKTLFVSERSRVKLTATDNKAGVEQINYKIDIKNTEKYSTPFALPKTSGQHTVSYFATDEVANVSPKKLLMLTLDLTSPNSNYSVKGPQAQVQDTLYIADKTKISLHAKDRQAGVQKIQYKLDDKSVTNYSTPISLSDHGAHKIVYYGTDNVNNKETENTFKFFVDTKKPKIISVFSIERKVEKTGLYPKGTKLYIGATDKNSGVDKIYYRINNGTKKQFQTLIPFNKLGKYTVYIEAVDLVGNIAKAKEEFEVKHIAPQN